MTGQVEDGNGGRATKCPILVQTWYNGLTIIWLNPVRPITDYSYYIGSKPCEITGVQQVKYNSLETNILTWKINIGSDHLNLSTIHVNSHTSTSHLQIYVLSGI